MASVTELEIPADCWFVVDISTGLMSSGKGDELWGDEMPQDDLAQAVAEMRYEILGESLDTDNDQV